jgi:hypothetical protein
MLAARQQAPQRLVAA